MKVVHLNNCPVCGSSKIETFLRGKDFFSSEKEFEVVQCKSCGFKFTKDFPNEANISSYYDSPEYISHSDTHKGFVNSMYHWVRSFMLNKKTTLVNSFSSTKGVLMDIGCGTGYFAGRMKQNGWDVLAIEKNPKAREFVKATWGLNPEDSELLYKISEKKIDVITLWHVLEHIEQLNETMKQMHAVLKDDGKLIIALPNSDSYDARVYKKYWAAYDLPRHLWHFSPSTFNYLAEQHGFQIIKTVRMPFDGFYIALLSEKYINRRCGKLIAFFHGFIGWLKSLSDAKNTSSLIYILKKKTEQ
jgi:predicted SAM-dependent methyltransferase